MTLLGNTISKFKEIHVILNFFKVPNWPKHRRRRWDFIWFEVLKWRTKGEIFWFAAIRDYPVKRDLFSMLYVVLWTRSLIWYLSRFDIWKIVFVHKFNIIPSSLISSLTTDFKLATGLIVHRASASMGWRDSPRARACWKISIFDCVRLKSVVFRYFSHWRACGVWCTKFNKWRN
jgi:hypothetical protein